MKKTTRIVLDEVDFVTLINGDIVEHQGVEIALADIGHQQMLRQLLNLMHPQRSPPDTDATRWPDRPSS